MDEFKQIINELTKKVDELTAKIKILENKERSSIKIIRSDNRDLYGNYTYTMDGKEIDYAKHFGSSNW